MTGCVESEARNPRIGSRATGSSFAAWPSC